MRLLYYSLIPLLGASLCAAALRLPNLTNLTSSHHNITFSVGNSDIRFNDTVEAIILETIADYRTAKVKGVEATIGTESPTDDWTELYEVRVIFSIPHTPTFNTIIVDMSENWGEWERPRFMRKYKLLENEILPLAALTMDLPEADQRIKEAGYAGRYWGCNLMWPKPKPGLTPQPYYLFMMEEVRPGDPPYVAVGVYDKEIVTAWPVNEILTSVRNGTVSPA